MTSLIIVLGVILVLVILYLIFRVASLVGIAKGRKTDQRVDSANSINAFLFIVFMVVALGTFFWYSFAHFEGYTLPIASIHGAHTDKLFWITMGVTVVAFTIISIVMFVFIFQYRYQEGRKAKYYPDNHYLELTWTIIPAIVLAVLIFTGLMLLSVSPKSLSKWRGSMPARAGFCGTVTVIVCFPEPMRCFCR